MKRAAGVVVALTFGVVPVYAQLPTTEQLPLPAGQTAAQTIAKNWDVVLNTEGRYTSATTTREGSPDTRSRMFYVPLGLQINGRPSDLVKIEFAARSGHVDSRTSNGTTASSYVGFLDTSLSLTTTYLGLNGLQPFVSINVNLPTGKTVFNNAAHTKPDSDIYEVAGFGEGLNIGPTVGVNIPLTTNLILSFGAGLTARGAFDRDGPGSAPFPTLGVIQHFNPGDVWTFNSSLGYQAGSLSLQFAGSYSTETTTTIDGPSFYKAGDRYSVSGGAGYAWNDHWSSKASASFSHFNKNHINLFPLPPGFLILEAFNSNSNVTTVSFDTTYRQGSFAVGPTVSFLYRDHNGYDPTHFQFVPAKTKWQAGGTAQYTVNDGISFNGRVEHVWATINAEPDEVVLGAPLPGTNVPPIYTRAWLVSLAAILKY